MTTAKNASHLLRNRDGAQSVLAGQANKLSAKAGGHSRMTQGRAVEEQQPSDVVVKPSIQDLNPRHIDVAFDAGNSDLSVHPSEAYPPVNSEATPPPSSSDGSGLGQYYRIFEDRNDVVGVGNTATVYAPNEKLVMVTSLSLAEPLSIPTTSVTLSSSIPIVRGLAVGVVMAGPVISSNDLEVQLFEADNVTFLGVAVIDETGHFLMGSS